MAEIVTWTLVGVAGGVAVVAAVSMFLRVGPPTRLPVVTVVRIVPLDRRPCRPPIVEADIDADRLADEIAAYLEHPSNQGNTP